eukprot:SAG31_NODE_2431_length_5707_cov_2.157810_11_plen_103_part_00
MNIDGVKIRVQSPAQTHIGVFQRTVRPLSVDLVAQVEHIPLMQSAASRPGPLKKNHTVSVWLSYTGVGSHIALPLSGFASASRFFQAGKLSASRTVVSCPQL